MWKKVIVFDALALDTERLSGSLRERGLNVESVHDDAAFERALQWWNPGAAVVGVDLGERCGEEVVRRIKSSAQPISTIVVAPLLPQTLRDIAGRCGADGFFSTLEAPEGLVGCLQTVYDALQQDDDSGVGW